MAKPQTRFVNIGDKIGKLTVLSKVPAYYMDKENPKPGYVCKCECGKEKTIREDNLIRKNPTMSCGCLLTEWGMQRRDPEKPHSHFRPRKKFVQIGRAHV